jgi:mono/diheme cytochrome c family protein
MRKSRTFIRGVIFASAVMTAAAIADDSSVAAKTSAGSSDGAEIYGGICQGCHMPQGQGAEGAGHYPKLAGNPNFGSWQFIALTVLNGRNGMPPFGLPAAEVKQIRATQLSDAQIADVVNYVRTHFGNKYASKVTAKDVAALPHPGKSAEQF